MEAVKQEATLARLRSAHAALSQQHGSASGAGGAGVPALTRKASLASSLSAALQKGSSGSLGACGGDEEQQLPDSEAGGGGGQAAGCARLLAACRRRWDGLSTGWAQFEMQASLCLCDWRGLVRVCIACAAGALRAAGSKEDGWGAALPAEGSQAAFPAAPRRLPRLCRCARWRCATHAAFCVPAPPCCWRPLRPWLLAFSWVGFLGTALCAAAVRRRCTCCLEHLPPAMAAQRRAGQAARTCISPPTHPTTCPDTHHHVRPPTHPPSRPPIHPSTRPPAHPPAQACCISK